MFVVQLLLKLTENNEKFPLFRLSYFFTLINNVLWIQATAVYRQLVFGFDMIGMS